MRKESFITVALFLGALGAFSVSSRAASDKASKGEDLYNKECVTCHQKNAQGSGIYPPLNTLTEEQIVQKLKGYKNGQGGNMKAIMEPYAKGKTDEEIEALASYIVTLKGRQ